MSLKDNKYVKMLGAAAAIGVGGIAGLFIIKSLLMLAIAIAVGLGIFYGAPLLHHLAKILQIKGVKLIAEKNPIEELELGRERRIKAINEASKKAAELGGLARTYKTDLDQFKATDPGKVQMFETTYINMAKVYNHQVTSIKKAKEALEKYDDELASAKRFWEMMLKMRAANKALKAFNQADAMDELREKTALDSVTKNFNTAMSELEVSMALDYNSATDLEQIKDVAPASAQALTNNPSEIIEADFTKVTKEAVAR